MSQEIFERALHDYQELGGHKSLYLSALCGEPLLDPNIIKKIHQAKRNGFFVSLTTNGISLNKIDTEALIKSNPDSISISTAPLDENSYRLIFRSCQYKDMLNGVIKLLEIRNSLNYQTNIFILFRSHISYKRLIQLTDYKEKVFPLLRHDEKKAISPCIKSFSAWGNQIQKKDLIGIMDFAKVPHFKMRPCQWTYFLTVLYDGKVRACPCNFTKTTNKDAKDELFIGELKDSSLKKIWSGRLMENVRRRFINGNLPKICMSCALYSSI